MVETRFTAEEIAGAVDRLAGEIARRHPPSASEPLLLVVCLKGAFVFAADLVRALDARRLHPEVDFVSLASYGPNTESSGRVRVRAEPDADPAGRDVVLVDDILDSGRSLDRACRLLVSRGARRVETCVLLDKPSRRVVERKADYVGFEIPDEFVVGYGIDWAERYRHLPYIGVVPSAEAGL